MKKHVKLDPVTGPIPRERFVEMVGLPHGKALAAIRQYDPLYGLKPGETIRWKVQCKGTMYGTAYVEAATEKEAEKLADKLSTAEVNWDDSADDWEILDIEPCAPQQR